MRRCIKGDRPIRLGNISNSFTGFSNIELAD